ncbi:MAG: Short-chain-enoyl-CoA hydratase [Gammaproteobacteria bacterium]|nr:Short-chain-enoyl-CoA hydratase [Gammaproteobacteria bacterium]
MHSPRRPKKTRPLSHRDGESGGNHPAKVSAMNIELDISDQVATITLNRPEIHNAFDDQLIAELNRSLEKVENDDNARLVVLAANGKSFSAGADLNWMRRMADYAEDENFNDAMKLADMLQRLDELRKPTIAKVQGHAFGGGVGLVACCDIAVAAEPAKFCLSEVRLGLIPSIIGPFVVRAIGAREARRYFQTAERFDAEEACRIGLVHHTVAPVKLDDVADEIIGNLLQGGPEAQAAAKAFIALNDQAPINKELLRDAAKRIANLRASPEGKEGLSAFLEKRPPKWRPAN